MMSQQQLSRQYSSVEFGFQRICNGRFLISHHSHDQKAALMTGGQTSPNNWQTKK
jgi:hypothetical protein